MMGQVCSWWAFGSLCSVGRTLMSDRIEAKAWMLLTPTYEGGVLGLRIAKLFRKRPTGDVAGFVMPLTVSVPRQMIEQEVTVMVTDDDPIVVIGTFDKAQLALEGLLDDLDE